MKLTRPYIEGSDIGIRFEPGDEFWVTRQVKGGGTETVYCEVVDDGHGHPMLKQKVSADG